jgi:hypothetical protein
MIIGARTLAIEMDTDKLWISPQALLLKHHPLLANVESNQPLWAFSGSDSVMDDTGSTTTIILKTNQEIVAGQELLLPFDQHLHSILPEWFDPVIPTLDDYKEADYLIQEARNTFREPKGPRGRNANKQQQTGMVGQGLRMVQRVVSRYRPAVAKLLPTAVDTLSTTYRGRAEDATSLYLGLQNRSAALLARHGLCLSDINATTRTSSDETAAGDEEAPLSMTAVVTRNVTKGELVQPLPLFIRLKSERRLTEGECDDHESSCQNSINSIYNPCWSRPETMVEFCPTFPLPSTLAIVERQGSNNHDAMTVEIQWSRWADATNTTDLDSSAVENKVCTTTVKTTICYWIYQCAMHEVVMILVRGMHWVGFDFDCFLRSAISCLLVERSIGIQLSMGLGGDSRFECWRQGTNIYSFLRKALALVDDRILLPLSSPSLSR